MEERLKCYLKEMEAQSAKWEKQGEDAMSEQERKCRMEDLLIHIAFFRHERLIHLIVTAVFALITMLAILCTLIAPQPALFILIIFLMILLIPYIRHYYILENGVQKLYRYYDRLAAQSLDVILRENRKK